MNIRFSSEFNMLKLSLKYVALWNRMCQMSSYLAVYSVTNFPIYFSTNLMWAVPSENESSEICG